MRHLDRSPALKSIAPVPSDFIGWNLPKADAVRRGESEARIGQGFETCSVTPAIHRRSSHDDIEVWNIGPERTYIVAEPAEVVAPRTPDQQRVADPDPAVTGILVTPQRLVLEPDERWAFRGSAAVRRGDLDRIYPVTYGRGTTLKRF